MNDVINGAISNGLTVVFPKYSEDDKVSDALAGNVLAIPPAEVGDDEDLCDTTKTLAEYFVKAMH